MEKHRLEVCPAHPLNSKVFLKYKSTMKKEIILIALFCLSLTLFVLILSYKTTMAVTNFSVQQQETIRFLNDRSALKLPYTQKELAHLDDVKKLIQRTDYLIYFSLLVSTLILTYYKRKKDYISKLLKIGGITIIAAVIIMAIVLVFKFNAAFTVFHFFLFPQGNWLFPADSLLIQIFPLVFFQEISLKIFAVSFGIGLVMIFMDKIFGGKKQ